MSEVDNDENEQASTDAPLRKPWTAPYVIISQVGHTAKILFKSEVSISPAANFGAAS